MPLLPGAAHALALPERFDFYSNLVEEIVLRGLEHPTCELKRNVTLSKENLTDRLDFVKLIQGLANSHSGTERLIVVGADQREKKFFEVANAAEFDAARLSPIYGLGLNTVAEVDMCSEPPSSRQRGTNSLLTIYC